NRASHAACSAEVGFPLRSILGKKYNPSPDKEVRSVATICSSLRICVKPIPLSNTRCDRAPHTKTVMVPAVVAIIHFLNSFILVLTSGASLTVDDDLSKRLSGLVVPKRFDRVFELKYPIDYWLQAIDRYRPVHCREVRTIACKDDADCCGRSVEDVQINRGRLVGQRAYGIDESVECDG